jgi:excisionase family DNA binding protein
MSEVTPHQDPPLRRRARGVVTVTPNLMMRTQAAAYLNITPEQLLLFVGDGELRFVNVGRGKKRPRYRFTKDDLDAFIHSRTKQEQVQCQFSAPRNPGKSTATTSTSKVIGFLERQAARASAKPKNTKN